MRIAGTIVLSSRSIRKLANRARRRMGVTIAEVVVASSLLAIAIVPILKALTAANLTRVRIERKTQSLTLARSKLEEIRARCTYHYDESAVGTSSLGSGYRCRVSDNADDTLRLVSVAVGFDADSDGVLSSDEVEATLSTYVARRQ